jgi:glycosyltransferase involved in cell wall biosynthesis
MAMPRRPTRILYVQPNNGIGGSDIALLRMIHALDRERWAPVVALPHEGPLSALLEEAGAELRYVPMRQLRTLPSPRYQLGYFASLLPGVYHLRDLIRSDRIDLVHSNSLYSLYGAFAARLAGQRHIWHVREIPPRIVVARRLLATAVRRLSSVVIAMSDACVEGLFGPGRPPLNLVVLPDGLDLSRWGAVVSGARIRAELGFADDIPLIGFIARLDPWKGLDVFLQAARLVAEREPRAQFLVVGEAPEGFERYRDRMKHLATVLGVASRVYFLGWRYRLDDIPEVMAALTVLCHTPVKPEPFGLVLIEAMAVGCPVVAARAGGPLEIIEDGVSGWLVPPGDAAAFADRLCRAIATPEARRRIIAGGRARVAERFSSARFAADLAHVYERVERAGAGIGAS